MCNRVPIVLAAASTPKTGAGRPQNSTVHHENVEVLIDGTLRDIENEFGGKVVRIDRNTLIAMDHLEGTVPSRLHFMTDLPNVAAVFRAERCPDENTPNCDQKKSACPLAGDLCPYPVTADRTGFGGSASGSDHRR